MDHTSLSASWKYSIFCADEM